MIKYIVFTIAVLAGGIALVNSDAPRQSTAHTSL